jgi:Heparinase II/III-like protein/Heparinase II/III N-terminus
MGHAAWKDRYRRLLSMGPDELRERLRQQLTARSDLWRYRLGAGFSPKRQSGGACKQPRFFFSGDNIPRLCALLRERLPSQAEQIVRSAERVCQHRFDLLGYEDLDYGKEVDWHSDRVHGKQAPRKPWFKVHYLEFAEVGDSKITWELNRHQHFVTLAKAYRLSGEEKFAVELFRQWDHWHRENPYPMGVNWASSLEVAFRSLSWLWTYFLLSGSPAMPVEFRPQLLQVLGVSAHHLENHLSTYFSPNTHLLGEGVALFFIGTLCPEFQAAPRWRRRGWEIVQQAARRQVRADGLHFEQSTYYHVYALDFFLHTAVLASVNQMAMPADFEQIVEKMLEVLCILGRSGPVPRLGDDDGGRLFDAGRNRAEHLLDPLATGAVLYGRGDFKLVSGGLREETLWLLGEQGVEEFDRLSEVKPVQESVALQTSGLYVMTDADGDRQLVIDAGPQGAHTAGHGHADALSVVANYAGRPLLIDPGTFEYMGKDSERNRFRGTPAHNTMVVDSRSQAEPNGPFAWAHLPSVAAEAWIRGRTFDLFVGSHDGYTRLPEPVLHRRWVFSLKSRFWLIRDLAMGTGKHQLDFYWHLDPTFSPHAGLANTFLGRDGKTGLHVIAAGEQGWSREILQDQWSPAYGRKDPCSVVHLTSVAELPAEFLTLLMPVASTSPGAGKLAKVPDSSLQSPVSAFSYSTGDEEHYVFFGQDKEWKLGDWHSDARFLCWSKGRDGSAHTLICCQFTFVQRRGQPVISSPRAVLHCEIIKRKGQTESVSSEPDAVINSQALEPILSTPSVAPVGNVPGQGAKS